MGGGRGGRGGQVVTRPAAPSSWPWVGQATSPTFDSKAVIGTPLNMLHVMSKLEQFEENHIYFMDVFIPISYVVV